MMLKEESKKQLITRATQYGVDPISVVDKYQKSIYTGLG